MRSLIGTAQCLLMLGKPQEALDEVVTLRRRLPADPDIMKLMSTCQLRCGKYDEAVHSTEAAKKFHEAYFTEKKLKRLSGTGARKEREDGTLLASEGREF